MEKEPLSLNKFEGFTAAVFLRKTATPRKTATHGKTAAVIRLPSIYQWREQWRIPPFINGEDLNPMKGFTDSSQLPPSGMESSSPKFLAFFHLKKCRKFWNSLHVFRRKHARETAPLPLRNGLQLRLHNKEQSSHFFFPKGLQNFLHFFR